MEYYTLVESDGKFVSIGVSIVEGIRLVDGLVTDRLAHCIEVTGNAGSLVLRIVDGFGGGTGVIGIAVGLGKETLLSKE